MNEKRMKNNYEREVFTINMEQFIREYIPKNWMEPIQEVDFVPHFSYEEIDEIFSGNIPERIRKWYIKEAIQEFVKKLTTKKVSGA
jgi:hypothetical protein